MRWLVPGNVITEIQAADPSLYATALNKPAVWAIGDPDSPFVSYATPIARYRSFAQFQNDLTNKTIDPAYRWVLYDPESWPDTPAAEQQDPRAAMRDFGQLAHAGRDPASPSYRVIMAPARDLGNVASYGKNPGEDLGAWYLRAHIAAHAALHGDVVSVQSQAVTLSLGATGAPGYVGFVTEAKAQALAANPFCKVLAGISTHYGTAAEMAAAAKSVQVAGFWLNVPGPAPDVGKACEFLRLMTGGAT